MKNLITYLSNTLECDGAATPGSVMGMGNPMAPEGDAVGSGDMMPPKRRKKVKPGKEKQEWPDDTGQIKEGLLSNDFGDDDNDLGLGFDGLLEDVMEQFKKPTMNEKSWSQLFEVFKISCKELEQRTKPATMSLMKACRKKDYTIVTFYNKSAGRGSTNCIYGIEFRKFIRNPLPTALQIAYLPDRGLVRWDDYKVNHPSAINFKLSEWFVLPGDVWDQIRSLID